jgi:hypothetical protein
MFESVICFSAAPFHFHETANFHYDLVSKNIYRPFSERKGTKNENTEADCMLHVIKGRHNQLVVSKSSFSTANMDIKHLRAKE